MITRSGAGLSAGESGGEGAGFTSFLPSVPMRESWVLATYLNLYYDRSKRYSSMTAATDLRPDSSLHRITRPVQFTMTSAGVPRTDAGMAMLKVMTEPTAISEST